MTLIKANTLSKYPKGASIWVPPVYDEGYRPRVVPVTEAREVFLREETRYTLPAGWSVNAYSNLGPEMNGQPRPSVVFTGVTPGSRQVGNIREVWSAYSFIYGTWVFMVRLYQRSTQTVGTTTEWEYYKTLLAPGYWLQIEIEPSWASGARSIKQGIAPWEMTFRLPHAPQGVVFGVAEAAKPQGLDQRTNIQAGFYVRGDDVFLWNPNALPVQELAPLVPRTDATIFKMVSDGVNITMHQGGIAALKIPDPTTGVESIVRAALYGTEDEVTQPTFIFSPNTGQGRADLRLFARAGTTEFESGAHINLTLAIDAHALENTVRLPLTLWVGGGDFGSEGAFDLGLSVITSAYGSTGGTGRADLSVSVSLAAAASYGEGSGYGFVVLTPALEMTGGDGTDESLQTLIFQSSVETEITAGQIAYQPVGVHAFIDATVFQHAATGARMGVHTSFATSRLLEQGIAARLGLSSTMEAGRLLAANIVTGVTAGAEIGYMVVLEQAIGEALELGTSLTAGVDLSALVDEVLQIGDGILPSATLSALMHTLIGVTAVHDFGAPSAVWSVTDTGSGAEGSTAYANYPFNSFACIDGEYFGASESGLYVLEGDTDEGQDIDAFADMGLRNFDSRALKGLVNAYVSTNASTPLRLHISVGEQTYVYDARGASAQHMTQRFDLGRGLRAHFFGLKLSNSGGAAFETDRIEFIANESKRRI